MIEAVNSAVSNAQLSSAIAAQASTANSLAARQADIESVSRAPVAPYLSLNVSMDTQYDTAVFQVRDSDTGDVLTQFPTEPTLQQRQAQAAQRQIQSQDAAPSPVVNERSSAEITRSSGGTSETVVQASIIAQSSSAPADVGTSAGAAQVAIAALSAGAQSGSNVATSTTSVTA